MTTPAVKRLHAATLAVATALLSTAITSPVAQAGTGPETGQCHNLTEEQTRETSWPEVKQVSCKSTHTSEVWEAGPMPRVKDRESWVRSRCSRARLLDAVGRAWKDGIEKHPVNLESLAFAGKSSYVCTAVAGKFVNGVRLVGTISGTLRANVEGPLGMGICLADNNGSPFPITSESCTTAPWKVGALLHLEELEGYGNKYPGAADIEEAATSACLPQKAEKYSYPTVAEWESGKRDVWCLTRVDTAEKAGTSATRRDE